MAKQVIDNGESGLVVRTKLNENFTELYDKDATQDSTIASKAASDHNHAGVYEPVDGTILRNGAIGVSVEAYDASIVKDGSYVHTDENFTSVEKSKLGDVAEDANKYEHPATHPLAMIDGAGTAAGKDVGTSAGNVVELDGAGKLPAIDGSQLTNVTSLTSDQQAAIDGAASPSSTNVLATIDDIPAASGGDMEVEVYDPGGVTDDAFSMANMFETAGSKVLTSSERSNIAINTSKVGITAEQTSAIAINSDKVGITTGQASDISTNTAHSSSSGNPHGTTKYDIALGNVDNTADTFKPISNDTATALSNKSDINHNHDSAYEPINSNIQTHIASAHAPSDAQKNSDITKTEIEDKLTGEITTHTHPASGSGGGRSGVTTYSTSSDIQLSEPSTLVQIVEATEVLDISLPDATTLDDTGVVYIFILSGKATTLKDNAGNIVAYPVGEEFTVTLLDNSSAAGSWNISPKPVKLYDLSAPTASVWDPGTYNGYCTGFKVLHFRDGYYLALHCRPAQNSRIQATGFKVGLDGSIDVGNGYDMTGFSNSAYPDAVQIDEGYAFVAYCNSGALFCKITYTIWSDPNYYTEKGSDATVWNPSSTNTYVPYELCLLSDTIGLVIFQNLDTHDCCIVSATLDTASKAVAMGTVLTTSKTCEDAVAIVAASDGYCVGVTNDDSSKKASAMIFELSGTDVVEKATLSDISGYEMWNLKVVQVAENRILVLGSDSNERLSGILLCYNGKAGELSIAVAEKFFTPFPDTDSSNLGNVLQLKVEVMIEDNSRVRIMVFDDYWDYIYTGIITTANDELDIQYTKVYLTGNNATAGGDLANNGEKTDRFFIANWRSTNMILGQELIGPK